MNSPTRSAQVILVAVCCFATLSTTAQEQQTVDPVRRLNGAFRRAYANARVELLSRSGPVILVRGDQLILIHKGKRAEGSVVDEAYHDLKTVAHLPLTIYSLLSSHADGKVNPDTLRELRTVRNLTTAATKAFENRLADAELESRQRGMLQACVSYVDQLLTSGNYSRRQLMKLLRTSVPQIQENLELAARYRIDNYHRQAAKWRTSLGAEAWARAHVLIPGSPMARTDSLAVQYFAKLLGERGEGSRIVYAESLFDEAQAMNRLGTHLLDTQIGVDFFSDPWRMHRDALGTAAARYLELLRLGDD